MNLLIFGLIVLCVFFIGVFVMAVIINTKYGDDSASYKLFAIRDRLIHAVVFQGVSRDDPWLDTLYDNVNSLLVHSNLLAGPSNWRLAREVGKHFANYPDAGKRLKEPPKAPIPNELRPILDDLDKALCELLENHIGIIFQLSAHRREQRRIQREKARQFRCMVGPSGGGALPAT